MLSGGSLRQPAHTHRASVHQAAKLVADLFRVARETAGLAESNGSLPPGLWFTSPAGWPPRTGISSGTLRSVIKYGRPLPLIYLLPQTTTTLYRIYYQQLVYCAISLTQLLQIYIQTHILQQAYIQKTVPLYQDVGLTKDTQLRRTERPTHNSKKSIECKTKNKQQPLYKYTESVISIPQSYFNKN